MDNIYEPTVLFDCPKCHCITKAFIEYRFNEAYNNSRKIREYEASSKDNIADADVIKEANDRIQEKYPKQRNLEESKARVLLQEYKLSKNPNWTVRYYTYVKRFKLSDNTCWYSAYLRLQPFKGIKCRICGNYQDI